MDKHDREMVLDAAPERLTTFLAQALLVTALALLVHGAATRENSFALRRSAADGPAFLSLTLRQPLVPVGLATAALLDVLLFGIAAAARGSAGPERPWPRPWDSAAALLVLACLWSVLLGVVGGLLRGPTGTGATWNADALATCLALIPYAVGREVLFRRLRAAYNRTAATVYLALAWSCRKEAIFNLLAVATVMAGATGLSPIWVAWALGFVKLRLLGGAVITITRTLADEGGFVRRG